MTTTRPAQAAPDWLKRHWLTILVLWIASGITYLIQLRFCKNAYPYDNPIFQFGSRQFDFNCFFERFQYFGTPRFFSYPSVPPFTYPAVVALIYKPFYALGYYRGHDAYLGLCIASYILAAVLFGRALQQRGLSRRAAWAFAATALITSYPVALQLYLANVETFVWIVVALGIWAWYREHFYLASLCFGLATSMKIFPFVFFGLLESRRKYKQILVGLALCVLVSLGALRILGPLHDSYRGIQEGLLYFQTVYVANFHPPESGMDHSLFAIPKIVLWKTGRGFELAAHYFLLAEALAGLALYVRIRKRAPLNQLLALTVASTVLPIVSHDYTLLHLYAPWALLILSTLELRGAVDRSLQLKLFCFAVLFTAQDYLIWTGMRYAGQLKCLCLLTLGGMAIFGREGRDAALVNQGAPLMRRRIPEAA
jgi:hypothetical protein